MQRPWGRNRTEMLGAEPVAGRVLGNQILDHVDHRGPCSISLRGRCSPQRVLNTGVNASMPTAMWRYEEQRCNWSTRGDLSIKR